MKDTRSALRRLNTALSDHAAERKTARDALRKERDMLRKCLDISTVIVVMIDDRRNVTMINKKGCEVLGYREDEIVGRDWFDNFLPERIRGKTGQIYAKLIRGECEYSGYHENPVLTRSGEERVIAWNNTVYQDDSGRIISTLSSGVDITDRRHIEEALKQSEKKYRQFFATVPNGWAYCRIVTDTKNRPVDYMFLEVNDAFEKQTGLKRETIIGRTATEIIPGIAHDPADWIGLYGEVALEGREIRREYCNEALDRWYLLTASCPQKEHFIVVLDDITYRKQAEEDLQKARDALELHVKERTSELEKTNAALLTEIHERRKIEDELKAADRNQRVYARELIEKNTALKVLLKQREEDRIELEQNILSNVKSLIQPYLMKLKRNKVPSSELAYLNIIESNLSQIISPFSCKLSSHYLRFSPKEIEIANLIKDGKQDKDITETLNISLETVKTHRKNIRKKLGIHGKRANLRTSLMSLFN